MLKLKSIQSKKLEKEKQAVRKKIFFLFIQKKTFPSKTPDADRPKMTRPVREV